MRVIAGITAAAVLIATTGCATSSKDVASAYVSPIQYQSYDCDQLAAESQRLTGRVQQLGGRLDEAANNDKVLTGVALLLFWPAAFAIGGRDTAKRRRQEVPRRDDRTSGREAGAGGEGPTQLPQPHATRHPRRPLERRSAPRATRFGGFSFAYPIAISYR
jgi:hypothetical protein